MTEVNNKNIHMLLLTEMYPNTVEIGQGIFVKRQVDAVSNLGVKVGVVSPNAISLRPQSIWSKLKALFKGKTCSVNAGRPVLNAPVLYLPKMRKQGAECWIKTAVSLCEDYIKRYGAPDLIHVHGSPRAAKAASIIKTRHNIGYIITEHYTSFIYDSLQQWEKENVKESFLHAKKIVAVSPCLKKHLTQYAADKYIDVIPNVVDTNFFQVKPKEYDANDEFKILCVANIDPRKRVGLLIEAFHLLLKESNNCSLHLVGGGLEPDKISALTSNQNNNEKIHFYGHSAPEVVRDLIQSCDLLVSSSTVETFGVTVIEAMACGKPVLSTRSGGPDDIIINNETGYLVEVDDLSGLAEKMLTIYREREMWANRTQKIRDHVMKKYDSLTIANQYIDLYEQTKK